jgi:hypothetical protein
MSHTTVSAIPPCDLDPAHGPAWADASIPAAGGSWAYVCLDCFEKHGCQLGLGSGQRLVLP